MTEPKKPVVIYAQVDDVVQDKIDAVFDRLFRLVAENSSSNVTEV